MKQLHILNGDASVPAFKATGLAGDTLVWREILSDGPAICNLPEDAFWAQRRQYIVSSFDSPADEYNQKVLSELSKLEQAAEYNEVILWFDADLVCQVNQLYLLSRLQQQELPNISITCLEAQEAIGLLSPERLIILYEQRQKLLPLQLKQAHALWQLYASPNALQLQEYLLEQEILLPHLKQALLLHLKRFPDCRTGLGEPQQLQLESIHQGATTLNELMHKFWQQAPGYGFGDWQLQVILRQLQPQLVSEQEPLQLTSAGQKVLQLAERAQLQPGQWLGGFELGNTPAYCYNSKTGMLETQA